MLVSCSATPKAPLFSPKIGRRASRMSHAIDIEPSRLSHWTATTQHRESPFCELKSLCSLLVFQFALRRSQLQLREGALSSLERSCSRFGSFLPLALGKGAQMEGKPMEKENKKSKLKWVLCARCKSSLKAPERAKSRALRANWPNTCSTRDRDCLRGASRNLLCWEGAKRSS